MSKPVWERGFRCHGYWVGVDRVGAVALPPGQNWGTPQRLIYRCWIDCKPDEIWEYKTLRAAKRRVEEEYKRHYK